MYVHVHIHDIVDMSCVYAYVFTTVVVFIIRATHTSELSVKSVAFTEIYKVIWSDGCVCKRLRLKMDKKPDNYKCFWHVRSLHEELQH